MNRRPWFPVLAILTFVTVLTPPPASAADRTSVLSSADATDRFDGMLSVRWDWQLRQSRISREFACDPTIAGCPATPGIVSKPELDSHRTTHLLNVDLRLGLYHDLELRVTLPVVLSDQTDLGRAGGVGPGNSQVDDGSGNGLFQVPHTGRKRSGFGDMAVGLRWAPLAQWRQARHPTLLLDATYTAPTGQTRRAWNSAVGSGLHQVHLEVAASRLWRFVEPYFGLFGDLRFPAPGNTLFRSYDRATQSHVGPGHAMGMVLGAEWFPWRVPRPDGKPGRYAGIDTGMSATYTFRGREATDLFEALGTTTCGNNPACVGTRSLKNMAAYDRTLAGAQGGPRTLDGVTDVASYGTIGAWVGVNVQPIEYLELSLRFTYQRETSHLLTNADTGRDLDPKNGAIDWVNGDGRNEYNPVFNSDIDDPGRRFRSNGTNVFGVMIRVSGRL